MTRHALHDSEHCSTLQIQAVGMYEGSCSVEAGLSGDQVGAFANCKVLALELSLAVCNGYFGQTTKHERSVQMDLCLYIHTREQEGEHAPQPCPTAAGKQGADLAQGCAPT